MPRFPRRCAHLIATAVASLLSTGIAGPTGLAGAAGLAGPAGSAADAASSRASAWVGSKPGERDEPCTILDAAFAYLSPGPNATLVQPGTTLILRPHERELVTYLSWSTTTVVGTVSGTHPGRWEIAGDGEVIVFHPSVPFTEGENVTVRLPALSPTARGVPEYSFTISPGIGARRIPDRTDEGEQPCAEVGDSLKEPGISAALPLDFPRYRINVNDDPAPGVIFTTNTQSRFATVSRSPYLMILENDGTPRFFRRFPHAVMDFKVQEANDLLSYAEAGEPPRIVLLDATYAPYDTFFAGNGYPELDFHDFQILPDEHALLIIYDWQPVDMSQVVPGGDPNALVAGLVIQELDLDKNVVFQWRSWDHFAITDAQGIDLTQDRIDYVHCNAIQQDADGNILFSARNTNEIAKVDRTTGEVLWRLGGAHNEFELHGDTEWFSRQHAVRRLESGTITLFDNGSARVPPRSRAIEYRIDESARTVTRVWQYEHPRALYGAIVGYVQRLPNGNTLVSFGNSGVNTEVRSDGTIAWEMEYEPELFNYRSYRDSWIGQAAHPSLWIAAADTVARTAVLGFETFGHAEPLVYRLFRSIGMGDESLVATTSASSVEVVDLPDGVPVHFRIETDLDSGLGTSDEVEVFFNPEASAIVRDVSAHQVPLGVELEWTAASDPRVVGFLVLRRSSSSGPSLLTDPPLPAGARSWVDRNALEGESYTYVVAALLDDGRQVRSAGTPVDVSTADLALYQGRPNPFADSTIIPFTIPSTGTVRLVVYDVRGRLVRVLVDEWMDSGLHRETWDGKDRHGTDVGEGVYFYRLTHGKSTKSGTTVRLQAP